MSASPVPQEAARSAPPGTVLHLGPSLAEPGGMAQVIRCYLEADLDPWRVDYVASYTAASRPRQLLRMLVAGGVILGRPRRRLLGVHLHLSEGFDLVRTLLLLQAARSRSLPTVVTVHGARFMHEVGRAPRLVRAIVSRATAVTVLSDEVDASVRALGAARVVMLPNPVRVRPAAAGPRASRQVLFAGEIGHRKGVDVLLAAWTTVHAAHPDATLLLLGPVAEPALTERLPAGVRLGGSLPQEAVVEALDGSCIAVLPSRAEAMPMFVLEAMAAGVPVVTTPVGAVEGVVGDGAILVPVGEPEPLAAALVDLLARPELLEQLGANARRIATERFSSEIFARNVVDLYDSVFAR